jgi:hypothetical protein
MMGGTFNISAYTTGFAGMEERFRVSQEVLAVGQFTFLAARFVGPGGVIPRTTI